MKRSLDPRDDPTTGSLTERWTSYNQPPPSDVIWACGVVLLFGLGLLLALGGLVWWLVHRW